jgi:hypothetical protein
VRGQIDVSGLLTKQLQHLVRQGNFFKVVGIDMTVSDFATPGDTGGQITGYLDYFTPTRGRCAAYRAAFRATANAMKLQGITMRSNPQYDFRVSFANNSVYPGSQQIKNHSTLDGTDGLSLIEPAGARSGVFAVHNQSVTPVTTGAPSFGTGYNTMGVQNTPTDFVLQETATGYTGNPMFADGDYESIPFQMTFTPGSTDVSTTFNWRPDPALYVAMMTGLIQIRLEELDFDGGAAALELNTAIHIAGWKSIMGDPSTKSRRSRKSSSSGKGRMTRSTTTVVKK